MSKDFVVCQDGVRVRLESACFDGWIKPKGLDDLQTYSAKTLDTNRYPGPKWVGSKMPAALIKQVLGTIHEFPRMETAYSLYYNTAKREWAVKCPDQSGAGASVHFYDDGTGMPEGFTLMGSIHTHPEMGAFWSGTDLNDQQFKAGLHIVFGLRNGLVAQHKCTGFFPNMQEDQDIWDVLEEVDFNQVYEPVAEWVETIKKQAYHPPVQYTWYGRQYTYQNGRTYYYGSQLPAGYYNANRGYAGFTYQNGYPQKPANQSYSGGYGWNYGSRKKKKNATPSYTGWAYDYPSWDNWYDDDDYDDYDVDVTGGSVKQAAKSDTKPTTPAVTQPTEIPDTAAEDVDAAETEFSVQQDETTKELKCAILDCLNDATNAARLVDVFTDPDVRGPLEQITGLVVTDSLDKDDVLISIECFLTGDTVLTTMTEEEAVQIFEGLMDLHPDLHVVNPKNALGNDDHVAALCALLAGVVDSYSQSDCISEPVFNELLGVLKNSYQALLTANATHHTAPEAEQEAQEC